jgi:hypothetical protein
MKFRPVPATAANLTNTELCRHIRHHYPNLSGPLEVMLLRMERTAYQEAPAVPHEEQPNACPHCGSPFENEDK